MEEKHSPFLIQTERIRAALAAPEMLAATMREGNPPDALLLTSPQNRFYATGFESSAGMAVIASGYAYFMTDFRYFEDAQRHIEGYILEMTGKGRTYFSIINEIIERHGIRHLWFEDDSMTYSEYRNAAKALKADLVPLGNMMFSLRGVKMPFELERLQAAQRIAEKSFDELLPEIRAGVTENALKARLTYLMLKNGSIRNSFDPIVVSGPNGSLCHGVPGERMLSAGDFVTIDFGCVYGGYCSDMTRTVAIGYVTDEMRKVYETVLQAQLTAISAANAGIVGCALDQTARTVIENAGYGEFFGHGLGHGLGIDVHDTPGASPGNKNPLPAGTVVTIEPGIYIPGRFGVRIEDVVVLHEGGCENITRTPKELLILP